MFFRHGHVVVGVAVVVVFDVVVVVVCGCCGCCSLGQVALSAQ
jgi:hypothetical protein